MDLPIVVSSLHPVEQATSSRTLVEANSFLRAAVNVERLNCVSRLFSTILTTASIVVFDAVRLVSFVPLALCDATWKTLSFPCRENGLYRAISASLRLIIAPLKIVQFIPLAIVDLLLRVLFIAAHAIGLLLPSISQRIDALQLLLLQVEFVTLLARARISPQRIALVLEHCPSMPRTELLHELLLYKERAFLFEHFPLFAGFLFDRESRLEAGEPSYQHRLASVRASSETAVLQDNLHAVLSPLLSNRALSRLQNDPTAFDILFKEQWPVVLTALIEVPSLRGEERPYEQIEGMSGDWLRFLAVCYAWTLYRIGDQELSVAHLRPLLQYVVDCSDQGREKALKNMRNAKVPQELVTIFEGIDKMITRSKPLHTDFPQWAKEQGLWPITRSSD